MREYTVKYRYKGSKIHSQIFETSITADTVKQARELAREDLAECFTIVRVTWSELPQTVKVYGFC